MKTTFGKLISRLDKAEKNLNFQTWEYNNRSLHIW